MKTKTLDERFADLMREYERQNEEWARTKAKLEALGDARVRVPRHLLAKLDAACKARVLH